MPRGHTADDSRGGASLQEVGRELGVTRERARQIERAALRKMRRELERTLGPLDLAAVRDSLRGEARGAHDEHDEPADNAIGYGEAKRRRGAHVQAATRELLRDPRQGDATIARACGCTEHVVRDARAGVVARRARRLPRGAGPAARDLPRLAAALRRADPSRDDEQIARMLGCSAADLAPPAAVGHAVHNVGHVVQRDAA